MGVTFIAKEGTYTAPATLTTKTITENGTYSAVDDSANGYSSVTVNVEGGGSSWQTVFEGSVETVDDDGDIIGIIENLTLTGDSIKATLNGTEYILPKIEHGYGAENESGIDFSTYPLFIATGEGVDSCTLWIPTAGTYTLKIEEPQSSGSSDFSTAEVTMSSVNFMPLPYIKDGDLVYEYPEDVGVYAVPIPSNGGTIITLDRNIPIIATGSATVVNNEIAQTTIVTITGDCTLTVED